MNESLYAILGVQPTATLDAIRTAFRRKALAVHPDKGGTHDEFMKVKIAFETLMDMKHHDEEGDIASAAAVAAMTHSQLVPEDQGGCPSAKGSRKRPRSSCEQQQRASHPTTTARVLPGQKCNNIRTSRRKRQSNFDSFDLGRVNSNRQKSMMQNRFQSAYFSRRLCNLLRQLGSEKRRAVILERFSELQRLALEQWMVTYVGQRIPKSKRQRLTETRSACLIERSVLNIYKAKCVVHQDLAESQGACLNQRSALDIRKANCVAYHEVNKLQRAKNTRGCEPLADDDLIKMFRNTDGQSESLSRGRAQTRGIASGIKNGQTWYCASVTLGMIEIMARKVRNLSLAIEFLVVVTDIKQRVIEGLKKGLDCKLFEVFFQEVLSAVLRDHSLDAESDLGLRFSIHVPTKRWIGRNLRTPCFRAAKLPWGLQAVRKFSDARGRVFRGRVCALSCNIKEHQNTWKNIRAVYLHFLSELGCSERIAASRLDAMEKAHWPKQQREIEQWNCHAMAREEKNQRLVERAQCRMEMRERRAMAKADASSRRAVQLASETIYNMVVSEDQTLQSIDYWLARWDRHASRKARMGWRAGKN
eukprot:gnl/MRDRNA2_/MRDRNA2_18925_c0_seq1.p1 gnl/MRDRNA2_/MRDRNA2_18925_c0~~gnl/MRDRNA2_/MRDRNA2_18925_c0_seq1.p1  ORF type:complete len:588 (+),score=106.26 gnl/MRDRNA2_/MRDRNA2_18925_c0_seq1:207-1970(+)